MPLAADLYIFRSQMKLYILLMPILTKGFSPLGSCSIHTRAKCRDACDRTFVIGNRNVRCCRGTGIYSYLDWNFKNCTGIRN